MNKIWSISSFPSTKTLIIGSIMTVIRDVIYKLVLWFLIIHFNVRQLVRSIKLNGLYLVIFLECCSSEDKLFANLKIQLIESVNVPDSLLLLDQKLWQRKNICKYSYLYKIMG